MIKSEKIKIETIVEARARIAALISSEIQVFQEQRVPNELIGLKIFNALIDARLEIEQLRETARRITNQLSKEIHDLVKESEGTRSS